MPESGEPLALVAITSSSSEAGELGTITCPLPFEILKVEPIPATPTERLNATLPAVERATIVAIPSVLGAVKFTLARPFDPVLAAIPLPVGVPVAGRGFEIDPAVKTSNVTSVLAMATPALLRARTSN
jgi:hypothetical protein